VWRKGQRLFMISAGAAKQIARVKKSDVEHELDHQDGAGILNGAKHADVVRFAANAFDESQQNVAAIQHGNRQQVDQSQVYIEHHAEPDGQLPAVLRAKEA